MGIMRCFYRGCCATVDLDEREEDWDAEHDRCARHLEDEQAEESAEETK